jgi:transposase InsO family protein
MPRDPAALSDPEVLFRYQIVSSVKALEHSGLGRSEAVRQVAGAQHLYDDVTARKVSERTIYRWLAAYRDEALGGLQPAGRGKLQGSLVLDARLLKFIAEERERDRDASIPELLRRAEQHEVIADAAELDRSTVWRTMCRMGIETRRRKQPGDADTRRFRHLERMQMVVADFKHFRAGIRRAKRVAVYFLDNASRFGLDVVVSTSERAEVVLQILYGVIGDFGLMDLLYWDGGPGFKDGEVLLVVSRLGVLAVRGRARYPEGHGCIEAFNRSLKARLLRTFDGAPDIDPDCSALTLRLRHDLFEVYNHLPHQALDGQTPYQRFTRSSRPLRPAPSGQWLLECFTVPLRRRVSADHVVSVDGVLYEVPRGHAGERATLYRRLLERTEQQDALYIRHRGELVRLHPVDLAFNATSGRARPEKARRRHRPAVPAKSASTLDFEKTFRSMLEADGGYPDHGDNDNNEE